MAKYKKSEITINSVIEACKKLFYEKGYMATHYNDIASESNVNPGLVYYHFKKKSHIAGIIFSEFLKNNKSFIQNLIGDKYDLQVCTAVEIRNYWNLIFKDEKFKRFFYEICLDRVVVELSKEVGEAFFRLHNKEYDLKMSEEMIKIISLSNTAVEAELFINYIEGYLQLSPIEVCEFDIRSVYEFMTIDYDRIQQIVQISDEIFSTMNIRLKDYFELELVD